MTKQMTQGVILWQTFALTIRHLAAPRLRTVDIGVTFTISQTNQQTLPAFARVFTPQFATIFITHISFRILASSETLPGFKHPIQQILLLWYTLYNNGYNVSEIYEIVIVNCVPLHCWTNVRYFCPNEFPQILNIWVSL